MGAQEEQERATEAARLKQEALEAERAELAAARTTVDAFLHAMGFTGVSQPRRQCCRSKYALHSAVEEKDVEAVQALLRCGADANAKNSAGKTPRELADRLNRKGSHDHILAALSHEFCQIDQFLL